VKAECPPKVSGRHRAPRHRGTSATLRPLRPNLRLLRLRATERIQPLSRLFPHTHTHTRARALEPAAASTNMKNNLVFLLVFLCSYELAHMSVSIIYTFHGPPLKALGLSKGDTAYPKVVDTVAWTAKVVFGLVSDSYSPCKLGYRLPYIVGGQLLTCVWFIAVALVTPRPGMGWDIYFAASFFRGVGMATVSVAVEGLACDANVPERMGLIQTVMAGGRLIGLFTANLLGGWVADRYGLQTLCVYLAVCVFPLVALPMALVGGVVEEREDGKKETAFEWTAFRSLLSRDTLGLLLFALTNNISSEIAGAVSTFFLNEERGLSIEAIGQLGTITGVCTFAGAYLTGWFMDNKDLRWMIATGTILNSLTCLVNIWTPQGSGPAFGYQVVLGIISGISGGQIYVVLVGLAMRSAPRGIAASYVSIILGISNASGIIGGLWGAQIVSNSTTCFVTGAIVAGVGLFSLLLFTPISYKPIPKTDKLGAEAKSEELEKGKGKPPSNELADGEGKAEWEISPLVSARAAQEWTPGKKGKGPLSARALERQ
jgi:MFS family permease